MKLDAYLDAKAWLQGPFARVPDLRGVAEALEGRHGEVVTEETLISIWGQECQRRVLRTLPRHRAPYKLDAYVRRYLGGESLVSVAASVDMPPVLLARQVLMRLGYSKQEVTRVIKWPFLVRRPKDFVVGGTGVSDGGEEAAEKWWSDEEEETCRERHGMELSWATAVSVGPLCGLVTLGSGLMLAGADPERLSAEVEATCRVDKYASPTQDRLRQEAGGRAEERLYAELRRRNIDFLTEEDLRAKGYPRTPDAVLAREMQVGGRRVRWIDSKAMFGDAHSHLQHSEQLAAYVKLFGPGMVIYWHDFIDALAWGAAMPPSPVPRVDHEEADEGREARAPLVSSAFGGAHRSEFLTTSEAWPVLGSAPPQAPKPPSAVGEGSQGPPPQPRRRLAPSFDSSVTREASGSETGTVPPSASGKIPVATTTLAPPAAMAPPTAPPPTGGGSKSKGGRRIQPTPLIRSDSLGGLGSRGGSGAATPSSTAPGTPLAGGTPLGGSPVPSAPGSPFGAPRLPPGSVWNVPDGGANNVVPRPHQPGAQEPGALSRKQNPSTKPVRRLRPVPVEGQLTSREIAQVRNQVLLAAQAAHNRHVILVDCLPEADLRPDTPEEDPADGTDASEMPSLLEALAREFAELGVEMDVFKDKVMKAEGAVLPQDASAVAVVAD